MAIAQQPAMTTEALSARDYLARSPHELPVPEPQRAWTFAKIAGLVVLTATGTALALAIVVGTALFALLSFH